MAKSGVNEAGNSDVTLKRDEVSELKLHQLNIIPPCNSKEDLITNESSALVDSTLGREVDSERSSHLNCNESDKSGNGRSCSSALSFELKDDAFESIGTLDLLPYEIIIHIVSYLDSKFIVSTLSKVCCLFSELCNDVNFWKSRIRRRWPKEYPALPGQCICTIESAVKGIFSAIAQVKDRQIFMLKTGTLCRKNQCAILAWNSGNVWTLDRGVFKRYMLASCESLCRLCQVHLLMFIVEYV